MEFSNYSFEEPTQKNNRYNNQNFSRISKIQEWSDWSNEEKNNYKLQKYIEEFCQKLSLSEYIIGSVVELVTKVINSIKDKNDGPKRSRVKDGIIISCIYYISKEQNLKLNYLDLARKISLDIKYVSRADKILMDLNFLNTNVINKIENPIDYVKTIIFKYSLNNQIQNIDKIISDTELLINICQDNDILLDHTPQSIGCSCFYYIICKQNKLLDLKTFSNIFSLSYVTLSKTFNKLKSLQTKIDKLLT